MNSWRTQAPYESTTCFCWKHWTSRTREVVTANEAEDINTEKTSFRANEKLLSVLSRKSPQQFQLFLDALDNCGQQHVRREIDNSNRGLSIFYCMVHRKRHSKVTFSEFFSSFIFTDRESKILMSHLWAPASFFPGAGKFTGVARIFSGCTFFLKKS